MSKINLATGKPLLSSDELDRLLNSDVSDTEIVSATELNVSATEISATKISDTKVSATKPTADISATKISATKYMNDYKRLHYDTLRIDLPKGRKELLKQEAAKRNISVTKLIQDAIEYYLESK